MDWRKLKKEYIAGGISYRQLAEKYGVSFGTLRNVAAKEHWTDLRDKVMTKENIKVVEALSSRNARLDKAVDLALEAACEYLKTPGKLRAVDLKDVTTALKNLRDLKGIKSEADAEEQQARIEALRARASASAPKDKDEGESGVILLSDVDETLQEGVVDG